MFPHERSLIEEYNGKPFAIVGVNSDAVDKVAKLNEAGNVTWRSLCEGRELAISRMWNVKVWPTVHLIDHEGRLRYKNVRGKEAIDKFVAGLVAGVEAPK